MSFDISRKKFDSLDDYLGVVMQQGRVQVDSDWNVLASQLIRRAQVGSLDTFGPAVVPRETINGFEISGPSAAFEIGPGRIYVDGLMAENHTLALKWDSRMAELSGTARLSGADLDAAPTGLVGTTPYDDQPYYPDPPLPPAADPYLVYVEVWQRDITYLQDPSLVDIAIGVDTTGRQQTVWQVKFLENVGDIDTTTNDVDIPGWLETIHPSSARLTTATGDLTDDENPCLLPPQAGYKGLENQLYRVQVHDSGPVGTATFKWSRDNATVFSRINAIPGGNEIQVESLGRDDVLRFNEGDWVEVTDDHRELKGIPGEIRRIQLGGGIDTATRTITLEGAPLPIGVAEGDFPVDGTNQTESERNTRVIRWDQSGIVFQEDETPHTDLDLAGSSGLIDIPAAGTRLFLEKGILVDFALENVVDEAAFESEFKVGDYWIFAARVNDASVEILDRAPPEGIHRHFAKLAIVHDPDIFDCRTLWPPESEGGESCACSVCVHPEEHNSGSSTIQQAIDEVTAQGGGTVCLTIGNYQITEPIRIVGESITLRGQGWQTQLTAVNQTAIIEVNSGGEGVASDIHIDNLFGVTTTIQGAVAAISVRNVIGFSLTDCFITSISALNDAAGLGIQFSGVMFNTTIDKCLIFANSGIVGPVDGQQEGFLATVDFTVSECIFSCDRAGMSFDGLCFHSGKLDLSHNHISEASRVGVQLTGGLIDYGAVTVESNFFKDCGSGVICGTKNLRLLHNDFEVERDNTGTDNAITLVDGLDPAEMGDQQIIGNRIRHYGGHGISVRTAVDNIMIKQNQISDILGSGFIIEASGSVNYLSLENNQFRRVDGHLGGDFNLAAAVLIQSAVRADVVNNLMERVVRNPETIRLRIAIAVANSANVNISGNRLYGVTPANFGGIGIGVFVDQSVSGFEVKDNEITRRALNNLEEDESAADARWFPLISGNLQGRSGIGSPPNAGDGTFVAAPMITVRDRLYVMTPTRLRIIGPGREGHNNGKITGNSLDGRTSLNSPSTIVNLTDFCDFSGNQAMSDAERLVVQLSANQVSASHNQISGSRDVPALLVAADQFAVIGNVLNGTIEVIQGGTRSSLPEPWGSLNIQR